MLEGKHVQLAQLTKEDLPLLLQWRNSISLKRLTGPGPFLPISVEQIDLSSTSTQIQFGIRELSSDSLVGYITLANIIWSNRTAGLGVYIGELEQFGKGWGSEAISLLLDYAFDELNLHRVHLEVVGYNQRAIRTYRKLGFVQEGTLRQHGERNGRRYDTLLFGVLASEWRERKT